MSSAAWWFRRSLLVALAASLTISWPAAAARKKKPGAVTKSDIALFPITRAGEANVDLIRAVEEALDKVLRTVYGAVYSGDTLRSRLKSAPGESIDKCNGDVACVTRLGRKLKIDDIFFADASAQGAGISVGAYVLSSVHGKVEGTAAISIANAAEVEPKLKAAFEDLFHVSFPEAGGSGGEMTMPDLVGLAAPDLAPLTTGPATSPGPADGTAANGGSTAATTTTDPATTGTTTISAAPVNVASTTPIAGSTGAPPPAAPHSAWLTYTGIGVLVTGAVVAGLGAIPAQQSTNAYNKIDKDGPNTTDQLTTQELKNKGDTNADRANLLFIVGGTLGVVGGALVAIDGLILSEVEPAMTITDGGAKASLSFRF